jgi:hypothetical protein
MFLSAVSLNPHHFFPTIETAVTAFRRLPGAQWTDGGQAGSGEAPPGQTAAETGARDLPASPTG